MMEGSITDIDRLVWERLNERGHLIREKMENDSQVIYQRTSKFNNNNQFGEVVERILGDLNDPVDVTFTLLANPSLGNILEERRKRAWLPEVLQILRKRELIYEMDSNGKQRINCLGLRGVSKSWRDIADSVFFESSFLDPLWYIQIDYATNWRVQCETERPQFFHWNKTNIDVTVMVQRRQINQALKFFPSQLDVSPSLFRKLYVDHKSYKVDPGRSLSFNQWLVNVGNFEQKLIEFLDTHGSSVWFFFYNPRMLGAANYLRLYDLLARMPNLKGLVVTAERVDLKENVLCPPSSYPFPFVGSLKYLKCDAHERPLNLRPLIRECVNIKNLKVEDYEDYQLDHLQMEGYATNVHSCIRRFQVNTIPPLRSLTLEGYGYGGGSPVEMSELWHVLNQFGETLTDLTIYAYINQCKSKEVLLDLPHLKRLRLWENEFGQKGRLTFDHFLLLKSLEKVRIAMDWEEHVRARPKGSEKGIVDIEGFRRKLHCSNIWSIFPNLKEVEFRDTWWDNLQDISCPNPYEIRHTEKEVRYVRNGNCVTRFKTRRNGNGLLEARYVKR